MGGQGRGGEDRDGHRDRGWVTERQGGTQRDREGDRETGRETERQGGRERDREGNRKGERVCCHQLVGVTPMATPKHLTSALIHTYTTHTNTHRSMNTYTEALTHTHVHTPRSLLSAKVLYCAHIDHSL